MWNQPFLGTDVYHAIHTFLLFGLFGYVMECVVLTIETKKLVLNRGFIKGPFCMIYGFAAVFLPALLRPFAHHVVLLFLAGMILATLFEYLTGKVMIRLFGSLWWDYSHKKFNYKGILCLESSLGWGLLAVLYMRVLYGLVHRLIDLYPVPLGRIAAVLLLSIFVVDFAYHLGKRLYARFLSRTVEGRLECGAAEDEPEIADPLS